MVGCCWWVCSPWGLPAARKRRPKLPRDPHRRSRSATRKCGSWWTKMSTAVGCGRPRRSRSEHACGATSSRCTSSTARWSRRSNCCSNWTRTPSRLRSTRARPKPRLWRLKKNAAEKDVARYTELVKSGGATQQQLEKARADAEAYEAQILAQMEEVKRYELDLAYSRVTAPIAGRISRRSSPKATS